MEGSRGVKGIGRQGKESRGETKGLATVYSRTMIQDLRKPGPEILELDK